MNRYRQAFRLFYFCFKPRKNAFYKTLGIVLICSIFELTVPQILSLYVDSFGEEQVYFLGLDVSFLKTFQGQVIILPIALLFFSALRFLLTYLKISTQGELGQKSLLGIRQQIYHKVQNSSFSYHDAKHTGTLISNLIEDVRYCTRFFEGGLFPIIDFFIFLFVLHLVLAVKFWYVAAALFLTLTCSMTSMLIIYTIIFPIFLKTKVHFASMVAEFTENMEGQLVVKAYGRQDRQAESYNEAVRQFHQTTIKELLWGTVANHSNLIGVFFSILAGLGSYIFYHHHFGIPVRVSDLLFIFASIAMLNGKGREFGRSFDSFIRFCISANRLQEFFTDFDKDNDQESNRPDLPFESIEINELYFAYQKNRPVLKDINLKLKSGDCLGIAGVTGSGKSTLLHLLHTFYEPGIGEILVDGRNLFHLDKSIYGHSIAIVFQDTFLFSGSIGANIAYGNPDAKIEDIIKVAKIAQAHDFITKLPNGYDSELGERGTTLSGGQRQRIGIARALLKYPKLLILDDCTSALDNNTESEILRALHEFSDNLITIIVSQRKSSFKVCNQIIVMDKGEIIERGQPKELDRKGTAFYQILTHKDEVDDATAK